MYSEDEFSYSETNFGILNSIAKNFITYQANDVVKQQSRVGELIDYQTPKCFLSQLQHNNTKSIPIIYTIIQSTGNENEPIMYILLPYMFDTYIFSTILYCVIYVSYIVNLRSYIIC